MVNFNIEDERRIPLMVRDTLVCAFTSLAFISVWLLGNFVGGYEGFIPFFVEGVLITIGFIGACLAAFWIFVPLDARGQIFPVLYK